jgi:hypothetical protein
MKRSSLVLCATVAGATLSCYWIEYAGGLQGMPMAVAGLPAEIIPFVISLLCIASLVVLLVVALAKRGPVSIVFSMLALSCLFLVLASAPAVKLFQIGFRRRINSTVTPDELRRIAEACHAAVPVDGYLPGPAKNLWDESQHRREWNALASSTAIGKLDPWLVIHNSADAVELSWGGALVGHWGVIIQLGDKKEKGDIADGIMTFNGPD